MHSDVTCGHAVRGRLTRLAFLPLVVAAAIALSFAATVGRAADGAKDEFLQPAIPEAAAFANEGRNPYFNLEIGATLFLQSPDGKEKLVVTVTKETKKVAGVETRVVEERETKDGQLVEVSRNYFAIAKPSMDLFYFGEDVDMYKDGKVASHEGSWLAGENGAKPGLLLPAKPTVGQKYYEEVAPKVAMDRAEVVSVSETVRVPGGKFKNCLKVSETSAVEAGGPEFKLYAAGVGLIQDGDLQLVKFDMKP